MHSDAIPLNGRVSVARRPVFKIADQVLRATSTTLGRLHQMLVAPQSWGRNSVKPRSRRGRVTLVGAGPGDPELLTVKALRAIESADVILFDALVSDAILELSGPRTDLICVGKRGGRPSCRQDDINTLMVRRARIGEHVVRLKSGDPAIFGRAGEEIFYLKAAGIEVGSVPGITAASAMAAAFGISLTHRHSAKSVRFVTGHSKTGGPPEDLDWQAIADPSATTVFYMGGPFAGHIAQRLIRLGISSDTPVGIAASLSRNSQQIARCKLVDLECTIAAFDHYEPLIIGIGAVYAEDLTPPLFPKRECRAF